jgi:3-hydroxyacyl-CoA dehydrogenase/enoyl-CoA hydratase/3-hydroxybutyryl-CoA epimerase/3-hydroxyacyl-CoA dehydrogenase/enoyl-CoA hydratase/3-hydroxybutyryl-CoA epimerase/enoyl-CoA isomerase
LPFDQPSHIARDAEARAWHNVQALAERNRRDTGLDCPATVRHEIRQLGVVGAGLMGTAIAAAAVRCGFPVALADSDPEALSGAAGRIARALADEGSAPGQKTADLVARLVTPTRQSARIAGCDLIIESVVENVSVKHAVYAWLSPALTDRTILASNTSTIPIGRLAARVRAPGRFCGVHFCHPVRHRPLVEIVRGPETTDQTTAAAVELAKAIEKMPIVVEDGPGFVVNRLLMPYLSEALELLLDGATLNQVEEAATRFGMAMGPLGMLDEIGLDVALKSGVVLREAFPDRTITSPLLIALVKAGLLGKKSGAGFFTYSGEPPSKGPARANPQVDGIVARWARCARRIDRGQIIDRLMLPMVLEATRLIDERRVRDPRDIDLAVLFGLGFPAARGGLLYWADSLGTDRLLQRLGSLAPLGERVRPTSLLREMASAGRRFYDRS